VFALVEGGNGDAWLELATHAGVTLDDVCDAAIAFLGKFMEKAGYSGPALPPDPSEESKGEIVEWDSAKAAEKDSQKKNAAVSMLLESGTGKVLCDLLIEAVLIVPHTKVTLRSPSLWKFIEQAAVPVVNHFVSREQPTPPQITLATGMIEFLQHLLSELVLVGLLEDAFIDHFEILTSLGAACDGVMEGRTMFYEELRAKFRDMNDARIARREEEAVGPNNNPRALEKKTSFVSSFRRLSWDEYPEEGGTAEQVNADGELNRKEFQSLMTFLGHQGDGTELETSKPSPLLRDASGLTQPGLFRQGALPGINYFDEAKLDEAFYAADRVRQNTPG
jgi:hypothetical protein